jgi:DNA-binding winged helix-turn-helix (wHTH) protein
MTMNVTSAESRPKGYRIGDLSVDVVRREIRRQGRILPCGKLTFELLVLLARNAPGVVSRSELVERLWSGRYVSPATIKRRVALLRETLGDRAEDPVYLRVVRGHGYALVPRVAPLGRFAMRRVPAIRFAAAAVIVVLAFFLGAEVGYQDGLRPQIPGRQGTETVIVTSWPSELSSDEYDLVMSAADGFIDAVRRTAFIDRFEPAPLGRESAGRGALTVVARATTNDVETVYLTLGLLRDDRPDVRPSRDGVLTLWSRELQDIPTARSPGMELAKSTNSSPQSIDPRDLRTHVLAETSDAGRYLMLVANYRFDRQEVGSLPRVISSEVADTVAMAIDEQFPRTPLGE